jgi:DNA repair exonuclease SbcCD nuclease subunit
MKFLHTADWQIGMKAVHVGAAGERVRAQRLEAAKNVISIARDEGVDFIVVAGDTFEDNAVSRTLVQKVGDILAAFGGPVYLIPGNHDPLAPGSVWQHGVWNSHAHLHVIDKAAPLAIPGGTLFPCPLFEKYSTSDPTAWVDASSASGIAIGVAHGNLEGLQQNEPDYPIPRTAASRSGLDYLALGHWHSFGAIADGQACICYSGTHETTKFGERDSGQVAIVEIGARGTAPKVTAKRSGTLAWQTLGGDEAKIVAAGDLTRLRERIEALQETQSSLLRVELSGVLHPGEVGEIERINELLASRFVFGRLDTGQLLPRPDDDTWLNEVPAGVMKTVAARLRDLSRADFNGERSAEASPAVATQALVELYRLLHEVRA